jgi:hypothetical protein
MQHPKCLEPPHGIQVMSNPYPGAEAKAGETYAN